MSSKICPSCGYDESGVRSDKMFEGAAKGAAAGAAVGSFIPIIGTSIGAAVGGFLGFASGTSHQKCKKCGHTWED